jgi:hypothetical protein
MENKIHVPNHQPDMNDENICVNNRSSLASEKNPQTLVECIGMFSVSWFITLC